MPRWRNDDYDIGKAFAAIEEELIASMVRNMDRHRAWEDDEGFQWEQWQALQLQSLEKYKQANAKKYAGKFRDINKTIDSVLWEARKTGNMSQEIKILNAIKKGFSGAKKLSSGATAEFFKLNDRKLEALIKATTDDIQRAETAILRMANDQYRKIIYNAQVYANSGAGTYEKAVDMATKDMLASGLNCVEYSNGARHTLADYAEMAIRTASKRAYLQGEGEKRQEWGISTVIVAKRGNPCPKCLPFVGKVLIDDVWSGGSRKDGKYPLMSTAIAAGLYHPRCKDSHTTYFPGISTADDTWTKEELAAIGQNYEAVQKQQHAKRQAERLGRMEKYSLDPENKKQYEQKAKLWKGVYFKTGGMTPGEYAATRDAMKRNYRDVTEEWLKNATPNSHNVVDLMEYTVDGVTYKVDGKHVVLDYKQHEKHIADVLADFCGKDVQMVPRVLYPQETQTPDYKINGVGYDLKTPEGSGKNTLYGMIKSKKKQSNNFVICLDRTELSVSEIDKQIEGIYASQHTRFVNIIVLLKNDKVLNVYKRKR